MNADMLAAFDILLEAVFEEKARLAEEVKETTLSGQFVKA